MCVYKIVCNICRNSWAICVREVSAGQIGSFWLIYVKKYIYKKKNNKIMIYKNEGLNRKAFLLPYFQYIYIYIWTGWLSGDLHYKIIFEKKKRILLIFFLINCQGVFLRGWNLFRAKSHRPFYGVNRSLNLSSPMKKKSILILLKKKKRNAVSKEKRKV